MIRRRASAPIVPLVAALGFALSGCASDPAAPPDTTSGSTPRLNLRPGRMVIQNDPTILATRLERASTPLFVRMKETPGRSAQQLSKPSRLDGVRLTLVGSVHAPSVGDRVVQANDIEIRGQTAIVGYNVAGDAFAGAVQVIDFAHPDRPELVSEVLYTDSDVDAVALEGSHLYVGLASSDPALTTPALLEELDLTGHGVAATGRVLQLPSWAVTDLAVQGNRVVAGTGAQDGGIALVERTGDAKLKLLSFAPNRDVRGLSMSGPYGVMAACGGSTSHACRHALPSLKVDSYFPVDGFRNEAAKGSIEVSGGYCYLGAGDGGFQIYSLSGTEYDHLENSAFSDVRPELMVTNAVSVDRGLAFVAAGPLGVQVVDVGRWCPESGVDNDGSGLRVLGQLLLEDGASSNMVKAKNDILVVAAGQGGVKLIRME